MNILVLRGSFAAVVRGQHLRVGLAETQRDEIVQVRGVEWPQDFLVGSLGFAGTFRLHNLRRL